ncbi:hypothetical protein FQR65_LT16084 [Abscondita terminalis]|nr:hypothetical protein FQR65_LT16084 [Abscondita terminalis]
MGNFCCNRKKEKKKIVLLLVGLDNAGKSVAVKGLAGEPHDGVVPTIGLSVTYLKHPEYVVKIFDLGGGSNIRAIWQRYFVDVHGVIFVVDSSDYQRLDEAKEVLYDLLSHEKISGKPILLLANKQDCQDALDELDLVEKLELETLVNIKRCPTLVETCSANESKIDGRIYKGYQWLINYIARDYINLNNRVEKDVKHQESEERKERLQKLEKLKKLNENMKRDDDIIESYSDYDRKLNGKDSFEQHSDIFYISNGHVVDDDSSSRSNESFPHPYYGYLDHEERPKSAVQLVKEQLELNTVKQPMFGGFVSNKTAPVTLYGVKQPKSACDRRRQFSNDRRMLKSAGANDQVFTISDGEMWAQRRFNTHISK